MRYVDVGNLEKIGSGSYADVYLLNCKYVIKYYFKNLENNILVGIKNRSFIYPDSIYYKDDKVLESRMRYVEGKPLNSIDYNLNLSTLIEMERLAFWDLSNLSEDGIIVSDMSGNNVLVGKNRLYFIDRDFDIRGRTAFILNNTQLNKLIINYILLDDVYVRRTILDMISNNRMMMLILKEMKIGSCSNLLIEFLVEYKELIRKKFGRNVDNIGDINSLIRRR